jgi:hypothetical protein
MRIFFFPRKLRATLMAQLFGDNVLENEYMNRLPASHVLAANQICIDFLRNNLSDSAEDVAHTLEVLLEGRLPENWDGRKDDGNGWFGTAREKMSAEEKVRLIHRFVKALATKEVISTPRSINPYIVHLSASEAEKLKGLVDKARSILKEKWDMEKPETKTLLKVINELSSEVTQKKVDFRSFLNGMIEANDVVAASGAEAKPVFLPIREAFGLVDSVRRNKETAALVEAEAPGGEQQIKRLPSPA